MLSDAELAALYKNRLIGKALADRIKASGSAEKLEAMELMHEMAAIKTYLLSKTLEVVVGHCSRVAEGVELKSLYDRWIDLAENELRRGYNTIKDGYQGLTSKEINQSTSEKARELDVRYSEMNNQQLAEECLRYQKVIEMFVRDYD